MNYENKLKEIINSNNTPFKDIDILVKYFPELLESKDEKIRKAIINVFASHKDYEVFFGASVEDILAWLEKQVEQKWTEEDEERLQRIINTLECDIKQFANDTDIVEVQNNILWLESLNPPKPEWNEDDEVTMNYLINRLTDISHKSSKSSNVDVYWNEIEWLKSIKQRME